MWNITIQQARLLTPSPRRLFRRATWVQKKIDTKNTNKEQTRCDHKIQAIMPTSQTAERLKCLSTPVEAQQTFGPSPKGLSNLSIYL